MSVLPLGWFQYKGLAYAYYDFTSKALVKSDVEGVYFLGEQVIDHSQAMAHLLYEQFWRHRHTFGQYLIPSEHLVEEFMSFLLMAGLQDFDLDQLASLANGLYTIATSQGVHHTTTVTSSTIIPQLSITDCLASSFTDEKKYLCFVCQRLHSRKGRLEACINAHLGERPYVCNRLCGDSLCAKSFASKSKLSRHSRPKEQKEGSCHFCEKALYRQNLARHERSCSARII
ncbi:hypothetical protein CPB86DRAFT_874875 [Serendipita vermifera]|nr:hypothetical protein CPB86DRAFT_874875 [Serendipita vermifera]